MKSLQEGGLSFTDKRQARHSSKKAVSQSKLNTQSGEEALQPYQAYEKLLREWVPFLKAEINTCVDFLMLKDGTSHMMPQGSTMSLAGKDDNVSSAQIQFHICTTSQPAETCLSSVSG